MGFVFSGLWGQGTFVGVAQLHEPLKDHEKQGFEI